MSKIKVNNLADAPSYQYDEITECWTNLVKAEDYGVFLGICAYKKLPEGRSPEDLAHPEGEAELFHVISGNGFVFLEGQEVTPLRAGDSFLLPAQPGHQIWSASDDEPIVILFVAMEAKRHG